jgi:ubiquinone/menaquinone biosynthesis C-methylase UbiE
MCASSNPSCTGVWEVDVEEGSTGNRRLPIRYSYEHRATASRIVRFRRDGATADIDTTRKEARVAKSHDAEAAERFDEWAADFGDDRLAGWFLHYQQLALARLSLDESSWILDVGCGPGAAVRSAAAHLPRGKACGIDISPRMIEKAVGLARNLENVEFEVASAEAIPYPDGTFDAVVCTCSFHHYGRPFDALREIRRVLKGGGELVLIDSARDVSFPIWLQDRYRRFFEKSHRSYYTTNEMRHLLRTAGLEIVQPMETFRRVMHLGKLFTGLMLVKCVKADDTPPAGARGTRAEPARQVNR